MSHATATTMSLRHALAALLAAAALPVAAALPAENYVLAASWEPAFCMGQPGKAECRSETPQRVDAHAFSLHGLWPQSSSYCGATAAQRRDDAAGRWAALPAVVLQPQTEAALELAQPGTQSFLERHEWLEHGSCSGLSQQDFFAAALAMLASVNAGHLREVVDDAVGGATTLARLQAAVAQDDGADGPAAVEFLCVRSGGQAWLEELRWHLHLPAQLAQAVGPEVLAQPGRRASASQLCPSAKPIRIRAVAGG